MLRETCKCVNDERHCSGVSSYLNFLHAQGISLSFFSAFSVFLFLFFLIDLDIVISHDPYFQFSEISHLLALNKTPPLAALISCCYTIDPLPMGK